VTTPPRRGNTGGSRPKRARETARQRAGTAQRARAAERAGAAQRVLTPRSLVLGAVVVLLVVVLAAPVHRYFASRSAVSNAAQQLRNDQRDLTAARAQLAKWADPGYVQQQARDRLQYAMPGETVYVVVRPGDKTAMQATSGEGESHGASKTTWNERLWASVQAAGSAK
jgi:cell division protein FtsB